MNSTVKFSLPIILENVVSVAVSMIYSSVTGALSKSSLAAAGVVSTGLQLISSLFSMLSVGSAVVTAQQIGHGDRLAASRTAEHTIFLAPVVSTAFTVLLYLISTPTLHLLMPGAEESFFAEGALYYRLMLLGVPGLIMTNTFASQLRASGDSRTPFIASFLSCAVQLASVILFTNYLNLGLAGTAYSIVCCRYISCIFMLIALMRSHRTLSVDVSRIFKIEKLYLRRIVTVGLHSSLESTAVQLGYVMVNSMMVSLGTYEAGVVNVFTAVWTLGGITQSIGSNITTTLVGQAIGAGKKREARISTFKILFWCEFVGLTLCLLSTIFSHQMAAFFSHDEEIINGASDFMWILMLLCVVAVGDNVTEPAVRASGDVRFTATSSISCVMLIRLPLTFLFCLKLNYSYYGLYAANIISLGVRLVIAIYRICSKKWGMHALT